MRYFRFWLDTHMINTENEVFVTFPDFIEESKIELEFYEMVMTNGKRFEWFDKAYVYEDGGWTSDEAREKYYSACVEHSFYEELEKEDWEFRRKRKR